MKCHSNYTRRRLRSSVCTINDMLFTSSGKHSIQLKYEMLEISFLIQLIESIHDTMYTDITECRGLLPLPSTSNTHRLQLILQAVFSLKLQAIMKCQASCWCFETGTSCRDWNKQYSQPSLQQHYQRCLLLFTKHQSLSSPKPSFSHQ